MRRLLLLVLACLALSHPVRSEPVADWEATLSLLTGSRADVERAIGLLRADASERARTLIDGIESGTLRYVEVEIDGAEVDRVVFTTEEGRSLRATDVLTGEDYGTFSSRKARKIRINNQLRALLAMIKAELALASPNPAERIAAADALVGKADAEVMATLEARLEIEQDAAVRMALSRAVNTMRLTGGTEEQRLAAIASLSGNLDPAVRDAMMSLRQDETQSESVKGALDDALAKIEAQRETMKVIETVFFGVSLGSVLLLAAIGLAITFGVMGVINMAHGETIMLGAYTTYFVQQGCLAAGISLDWSLPLAIPLAFLVAGGFGVLLERGMIRHLYGRPLETLLLTFGISLILQQAMRTFVSPNNREVANPSYMSGSWEINGALALTYNRLYIIIFAIVVFAALLYLLRYSGLGRRVRAVMQNRRMAASMGINTRMVDALTFGLGCGIAGIAGVAISQIDNVGPDMGRDYIIDSFMVVVFGGVGNLWGTLVGALTLGMVNKVAEPYAGAVLGKVLVLIGIILFIQRRPRGLFALKGRAVDT